jgi:hypothetical protein
MSRSIHHCDGFEILVSQHGQAELLAIYDKPAVTSGAQDTSQVIEHVEDFSGSTCKAYVLKSSSKPLKVRPILEPGFNFLSGNATIFKLSTMAADGHMLVVWDSTRILKSDHATRRRNDSTACDWAKVPTSEDDDGRMIISAIRGNSKWFDSRLRSAQWRRRDALHGRDRVAITEFCLDEGWAVESHARENPHSASCIN